MKQRLLAGLLMACLALSATQIAVAQPVLDQSPFISPLTIPLYLSGNFGEIRGNHFHTGLDMKTQAREGLSVVAVADGYISRIKIDLGGYGKALYVTHPNGYTTVYAHLQRFNETIEAYVRKAQYQKQSYTIELFPMPEVLPVSQGEQIALSGNSGGSGGPHLHFEVRETESELALNPLHFGFAVKDSRAPQFQLLALYPIGVESQANGRGKPSYLKVIGANGKYRLEQSGPLKIHGQVGFGLQVLDRMNETRNRYGVYEVQLYGNDELIYEHRIDTLNFGLKRYINAHVDYAQVKLNKRRVQRSFKLPHNNLNIYGDLRGTGIVSFPEDSLTRFRYVITDVAGNSSSLEFEAIAAPIKPLQQGQKDPVIQTCSYFKQCSINQDGCEIRIPPWSLYDDVDLTYRTSSPIKGAITPTYHVHKITEPLHDYMTLRLRIPELTPREAEKALVVALTKDKKILAPEGGKVEGRKISIRTRSFGPYTVMIDSIPPTVKLHNAVSGSSLLGKKKLEFTVKDNLAGIATWHTYINEKWVLTEYDRKRNRMTYFIQASELKAGNNKLRLVVTDKKGNEKTLQATFTY